MKKVLTTSIKYSLCLILFVCSSFLTQAQVNLQITIDSGSSTTTCTDAIGLPYAGWAVNINGSGYEEYPSFNGICYNDTPNTQYDETFICIDNLPTMIEICFQAYELDGLPCNTITKSCDEEICNDYVVPASGDNASYTLALADGLESDGEVTFTISVSGAFTSSQNDQLCNAIDFGELPFLGTVGDQNNSIYDNFCGTSFNEPNPLSDGLWNNNKGVWFTFTTSADPSSITIIEAQNDPSNLGDPMDVQLAIYTSDDGTCSGTMDLFKASSGGGTVDDERLKIDCLPPNETFFLLVDGGGSNIAGGIEGYFGLEIITIGSTEGGDRICDAENIGTVPVGSTLVANAQTNVCAGDAGDPNTNAFNTQTSVWFEFNAPPSGDITIDVISDLLFPNGIDAIQLQLALFETSTNDCTGSLNELGSVYDNSSYDQTLSSNCLIPGQSYWILVDGGPSNITGMFDIVITDNENYPPELMLDVDICFGESIIIGDNSYDTDGPIFEVYPASIGCDTIVTGMVNVIPEITTMIDPILCFGQSLTVGNSSYSASGMYTDVLTSYQGCDSTVFTNLTVLDEAVNATVTETMESTGQGIPDGEAMVVATGGSGNYTYEWSDGQTTATAINLNGGETYCVTVTDEFDCEDIACVTIFYPGAVDVNAPNHVLDCIGDADGFINFQVNGDNPGFAYEWGEDFGPAIDNGIIFSAGGSATISGLSAGTYTITVTDNLGLSVVVVAEVLDPAPLISAIDTTLCFGESITIGSTLYNSTSNVNETVTSFLGCDSLISGSVTVLAPIETILPDTTICFGESIMVGNTSYNSSTTINEVLTSYLDCDSIITGNLTVLPLIETVIDTTLCFGESLTVGSTNYPNSGAISETLTAFNGCDSLVTGSLTILMENITDLGDQTLCAEDTLFVGGTPIDDDGPFSISLTDVNGCDSIIQGNVIKLNPIVEELNITLCFGECIMIGNNNYDLPATIDETVTAVNGCDSLITGTVSVLDFNETILNDTTLCFGENLQIGSTTYTSTTAISDTLIGFNGCDSTVTVLLTVLDEINTTIDTTLCFGESLTIGTTVYDTNEMINEVLTSFNGCDSTLTGSVVFLPEISTDLGNLTSCFGDTIFVGATAYTSTAVINEILPSFNGCDSTVVGNLTVLDEIATNIDTTLCFGESLMIGSTLYDASGNINEILTAPIGCDSTVTGNITILPEIMTDLGNIVLCFGESLTVGNNTFTTSSMINEVIPSSIGCDSSIIGNLTILPAITFAIDSTLCFGGSLQVGNSTYSTSGVFMDTLVSANNCDSIITTNLTILDEVLIDVIIINGATDLGTLDGVAQASTIGGSSNYTYEWSDGQITETAIDLEGGANYCVTVTDDLGCENVDCFFMPYPIPIIGSIDHIDLSCNGNASGQLNVIASQGIPPYDFTWLNIDDGSTGMGTINADGEMAIIDGLTAGNYSVTLTNGLVETVVTDEILQPDPITITLIDQQNVSCFAACDALVDIEVSGGTGTYDFAWTNNATTADLTASCAGDYTLVVTDQNNCTAEFTTSITEPEEFLIQTYQSNPVSCNGGNDGDATISTNGTPIEFLWSNGETSEVINDLFAGDYSVTVTNSDGCTTIGSINILEPLSDINVSISLTEPISCFNTSDGAALATATGSNGNFLYEWSSGSTIDAADNLAVGTYSVTVTDEQGCTQEDSISLTAPPEIIAEISSVDFTCFDEPNEGSITIDTVFGGVGPYVYSLDGEAYFESSNFAGSEAGAYDVYIEDAAGCVANFPVSIAASDFLEVELGEQLTIKLGETAQLEALVTNGNAVVYTWNSPDSLSCEACPFPTVTPSNNIFVTVSVVDTLSGCSDEDELWITVEKDRNVFIPNAFTPDGDGFNDLFVINGGDDVEMVNYFRVFDRWGEKLYEATNFQANDTDYGWNGLYRGKSAANGVYIYVAEIQFIDGELIQYSGDITLMTK